MAAVIYAERAIADLARLSEFLRESDEAAASSTVALIQDALHVPRRHPVIGRPVGDGFRELVISRGRTGYVALYEYLEQPDAVVVHGVRHQRESGFQD